MALNAESYATVKDLRDQNLPSTVSDVEARRLLLLASQFVESYTRNIFRAETGTFTLDGNNSTILHFPIPIISVSALKVNNQTTALDVSSYRVYSGRTRPRDDRRNPKIELRSSAESSIFSSLYSGVFERGKDQVVTGSFGWLEPDDKVPEAIREAVMVLAMKHSSKLYCEYGGLESQDSRLVGALKREKTDDHEMQWYEREKGKLTDDGWLPPIVKALLREYRAPRIAVVTDVKWADVDLYDT